MSEAETLSAKEEKEIIATVNQQLSQNPDVVNGTIKV